MQAALLGFGWTTFPWYAKERIPDPAWHCICMLHILLLIRNALFLGVGNNELLFLGRVMS
jgi:hypothetical protein